jgi:hypothetical protein
MPAAELSWTLIGWVVGSELASAAEASHNSLRKHGARSTTSRKPPFEESMAEHRLTRTDSGTNGYRWLRRLGQWGRLAGQLP